MSGRDLDAPTSGPAAARRKLADLRLSVLLLAFVVTLALVTLGFQGNWPKVLRVSLSVVAYGTVLLLLARRSERRLRVGTRLPLFWFTAAGAAAGALSGLLQPVFRAPTLLLGTVGAALFLGTVHWVGLHFGRRTLDRMLAAPQGGLSAEGRTR